MDFLYNAFDFLFKLVLINRFYDIPLGPIVQGFLCVLKIAVARENQKPRHPGHNFRMLVDFL